MTSAIYERTLSDIICLCVCRLAFHVKFQSLRIDTVYSFHLTQVKSAIENANKNGKGLNIGDLLKYVVTARFILIHRHVFL